MTSRSKQIASWTAALTLSPWLSIAAVTAAYAYLGPAIPYVPRNVVFGVGLALGVLTGALFVLVSALCDVALLALVRSPLPHARFAWLAGAGSAAIFTGSYAFLHPWRYWRGGVWTVVGIMAAPPVVGAVARTALASLATRRANVREHTDLHATK